MKNITGKSNSFLTESTFFKSPSALINPRNTINSATNANISASALISGHIIRNGFNLSVTDTLPSAVDLVNIIPNCSVGDSFSFEIYVAPTTWNIGGSGTIGCSWAFNVGAGGQNRGNFNTFTFASGNPALNYTGVITITNVTSPSYYILRMANVGSTL